MIDIRLELNNNSIRPGLLTESKEWKTLLMENDIEKVGFFNRKLLGAMPKEKIWLSKNCEFILFDELTVKPNIHGQRMRLGPGADIEGAQWGTSVYFSFISNKLFKVAIQVIGHWEPAHRFIYNCKGFIEIIYENMAPDYEDKHQDYDNSFKIIYSDSDSDLRLVYKGSSGYGALISTCDPRKL